MIRVTPLDATGFELWADPDPRDEEDRITPQARRGTTRRNLRGSDRACIDEQRRISETGRNGGLTSYLWWQHERVLRVAPDLRRGTCGQHEAAGGADPRENWQRLSDHSPATERTVAASLRWTRGLGVCKLGLHRLAGVLSNDGACRKLHPRSEFEPGVEQSFNRPRQRSSQLV